MGFLCKLDTSIIVDARRYGIPIFQLLELDRVYHEEHGYNRKPSSLNDLLEVVC